MEPIQGEVQIKGINKSEAAKANLSAVEYACTKIKIVNRCLKEIRGNFIMTNSF